MKRLKTAFFDLACCEGCQLQAANIGEALIDVLQLIEIVEFREIMSEKHQGELDIAIIEGSVTIPEAQEMAKKIRERAKIVIAYGACAVIGGVNGMKNLRPLDIEMKEVYGDKANLFEVTKARPVSSVIKVDYEVPGCPIYPPEFLKVLRQAALGLPYNSPGYSVCVECRFNENECMYSKGVNCLGPITRAGCNSWCTNNGNRCYGCRGFVDNPNMEGMKELMEAGGLKMDEVVKEMDLYNAAVKGGSDEPKN